MTLSIPHTKSEEVATREYTSDENLLLRGLIHIARCLILAVEHVERKNSSKRPGKWNPVSFTNINLKEMLTYLTHPEKYQITPDTLPTIIERMVTALEDAKLFMQRQYHGTVYRLEVYPTILGIVWNMHNEATDPEYIKTSLSELVPELFWETIEERNRSMGMDLTARAEHMTPSEKRDTLGPIIRQVYSVPKTNYVRENVIVRHAVEDFYKQHQLA